MNNAIFRSKVFEANEVFTYRSRLWNWILGRNAKAKFTFSD